MVKGSRAGTEDLCDQAGGVRRHPEEAALAGRVALPCERSVDALDAHDRRTRRVAGERVRRAVREPVSRYVLGRQRQEVASRRNVGRRLPADGVRALAHPPRARVDRLHVRARALDVEGDCGRLGQPEADPRAVSEAVSVRAERGQQWPVCRERLTPARDPKPLEERRAGVEPEADGCGDTAAGDQLRLVVAVPNLPAVEGPVPEQQDLPPPGRRIQPSDRPSLQVRKPDPDTQVAADLPVNRQRPCGGRERCGRELDRGGTRRRSEGEPSEQDDDNPHR
jgi:hypothetical protein